MFATSITERDTWSHDGARAFILRATSPAGPVRVTLEPGHALVVGTSRGADVVLDDRRVSRRHARLESKAEGVRVTDLDSSNGTFVRGVRIAVGWLSLGEELTVGDTTLQLEPVGEHDSIPEITPEAERFGRMIGKSPVMRRLFAHAARLAVTHLPLLVQGERGTGKELLVEEIHAASARAEAPLVVFDAQDEDPRDAALALFGADPGVFPSLPLGREGLLAQAHGGTLLLDEPETLLPDVQRRLARALERKEVQRLGSERKTPLDVRILAVADRDLEQAVERGGFREDLFYLLAGGRLDVPALRDRPEDVPLLARHFWTAHARFGKPVAIDELVVQRWAAQRWPGNVRELETTVARTLATGRAEQAPRGAPQAELGGEGLVEAVLAANLPLVQARQEIVARFEERYIDRLLQQHDGNVTRAAQASGLAHRYFQTLKARYGR